MAPLYCERQIVEEPVPRLQPQWPEELRGSGYIPYDGIQRPDARLLAPSASAYPISHEEQQCPGRRAKPLTLLHRNAGRFDLDRPVEARDEELVLVYGSHSAYVGAAERIDLGAVNDDRKSLNE
jgi:hypothetical protein